MRVGVGGEHCRVDELPATSPALPRRPPEVSGRGDYYALLHRGERGAAYAVWSTSLRQHLPVIAVPTRAPRPDTPLDLQAIVAPAYRRGHYDIAIDYGTPVPPPPLSPADAQWLAERIAAWRV